MSSSEYYIPLLHRSCANLNLDSKISLIRAGHANAILAAIKGARVANNRPAIIFASLLVFEIGTLQQQRLHRRVGLGNADDIFIDLFEFFVGVIKMVDRCS